MRLAVAAAALALGLAACATAAPQKVHYSLVPVKSNGQALTGMDSSVTLESRQPGGIVSVKADDQFPDYGPSFIVAVQNKSGAPQAFGPQSIEASIGGKKIPVLGAVELYEKVQGELRGYVRATNRTGSKDIEDASESANRDYRFNNFGGCPAGQSGCAINSDDNGSNYRQDRIDRELEAKNTAELATKLYASQKLIEQRGLRPLQLPADAMGGGIVVVQAPPAGGVVDLTVTFAGQKHTFSFNAKPTT